ncbi:MAG TPA: hypothetical protein VG986_19505 [Pseudolabrys sp.]|nr:hypothetical protein [Pseudolabrys sp.]
MSKLGRTVAACAAAAAALFAASLVSSELAAAQFKQRGNKPAGSGHKAGGFTFD